MSAWRTGWACIILVGLLGSQLLAATSAVPGADSRWRHWRSPNFEVYSRDRDPETRELLHSLELLRALFLGTFKLQERLPLPVTAYCFDTEKLFRVYKPEGYRTNRDYRGFYLLQPDLGFIMMGSEHEQDEARRVIFHEYVHHLVRVSGEEPPPWFNEGVAELFSSIEVHDDHLALGRPHPGRVAQLQAERLLPLEQVFGATYHSPMFRDGRHTGVFYSQSWALMHFCHFGNSKLPREKLEQFLRLAQAPKLSAEPDKLEAVCRELLGLDFAALNRELDRYMRSGQYSWGKLPLPAIPPATSYTVRAVPAEEMELHLTQMQLRVNRDPSAKLALLHAVERLPEAYALQEALGTAARFEGDEEGARDRWQRAVSLGTTNPAVFHQLGLMESRRWFQHFDLHFRMPDETAARLRDLLKRSIDAAPQQSSAYEMLAWVEATARSPDLANVNLVQSRYPTLKEKPRTLLALAMVRWRNEDHATATKLLDALDAMEAGEWVDYGSEQIRARIEGRPAERNRAPGTTRGKAPPVRVPGIKAPKSVQLPGRN